MSVFPSVELLWLSGWPSWSWVLSEALLWQHGPSIASVHGSPRFSDSPQCVYSNPRQVSGRELWCILSLPSSPALITIPPRLPLPEEQGGHRKDPWHCRSSPWEPEEWKGGWVRGPVGGLCPQDRKDTPLGTSWDHSCLNPTSAPRPIWMSALHTLGHGGSWVLLLNIMSSWHPLLILLRC